MARGVARTSEPGTPVECDVAGRPRRYGVHKKMAMSSSDTQFSAGSLYTLITRGLFHCSPRSRAVGDPRVSLFRTRSQSAWSPDPSPRVACWGDRRGARPQGQYPAIFLGRPGQGLREYTRAAVRVTDLPHGDTAELDEMPLATSASYQGPWGPFSRPRPPGEAARSRPKPQLTS
jgi:hypothetical protein